MPLTVEAERKKHEARLADLRREYAAKKAKELAAHAERKRAVVAYGDGIVEEATVKQQLERELEELKQRNSDEITLGYRDSSRRHREALGLPPDSEYLELETVEGGALLKDDPDVVAWRDWLTQLAQREGIDLRIWRDPRIRQGTAVASRNWVSIPPIQSPETAAIAAHEVGHCVHRKAHPDTPEGTRIKTELGTLNVQDELGAWRWAMRHAPSWTSRHHAFLPKTLGTYRTHATEDEKAEIAWLIGDGGFRQARLWQATQTYDRYVVQIEAKRRYA